MMDAEDTSELLRYSAIEARARSIVKSARLSGNKHRQKRALRLAHAAHKLANRYVFVGA